MNDDSFKDFVLVGRFSLDIQIGRSEFMVRKYLPYFDDADLEETPFVLHKISWEEIKIQILGHLAQLS
jgi:hypothetical protein